VVYREIKTAKLTVNHDVTGLL